MLISNSDRLTLMYYLLHVLNKYRIGVYLFYILLMYSHWSWLPIYSVALIYDPRIHIGVVFIISLIWIYLLNRYTDRNEDSISQPNELMHKNSELLLFFLSGLVGISLFAMYVSNYSLFPLIAFLLLGFFYSYPVMGTMRIKNILLLKNIVAGVMLTIPIVAGVFIYFPHAYIRIPEINFLTYFGVFLIFVAFELFWDIRDIAGDKVHAVQTVPVVYGEKFAKALALSLVIIGYSCMSLSLMNTCLGIVICVAVLYAGQNRGVNYYYNTLYMLSFIIALFQVWK